MFPQAQTALLKAIVDEWQTLSPSFRPWGVWIRRYPALPPSQNQIIASMMPLPLSVWFLDERGIQPHSVSEWQRFYVVHFEQPWCTKFFSMEPVNVYGAGQIGLAAFAAITDTKCYLETQWDGRYGHGWEVTVGTDSQLSARTELWIQ